MPTQPPFLAVTTVSEFPMTKYIFVKFAYDSIDFYEYDIICAGRCYSSAKRMFI
jgi:hypothetical protein